MTSSTCGIARTLLLASCLATTALAQDRFSDVTDVLVVDIPVQVMVDGEPLRDLTAADFEVRDGRKKREIIGFEAIDLGADSEGVYSTADVSGPARRHFLFMFDLALSSPHAVLRARRAAQELIASSLHSTDLVAVGIYSTAGSQILLGFTGDRDQIDVAIETLGMRSLIHGSPDPLGIVLTDQPVGPASVRNGEVGGIDANAELTEILTQMQDAAAGSADQNTILALSSSLGALAQMIGSVQGRKHVVFFSEGFNSTIPFGLGVEREIERQQAQAQAEAAMTGRYWDVNSDLRFGNTSTLASIDEMAKEFVRAGAAVHTVDIGGIRADNDVRARSSSNDGLFVIADKTGGEFYRSYNDLGAAMGKLLERTSVTYVLTIQPTDLPPTGRYRTLSVKLKNKPRGAQIVHRPGYFAPKPYSEQTAIERRMFTAQLLLGEREGGSVGLEVEARPLDGSKSGLDLSVQVDGPSLLQELRGTKFPAEFFAYALDSNGKVRDFISRTVMFDLDTIGQQLRDEGHLLTARLELPPGEYSLRTLVRNTVTGRTGLRITRVQVPERL